MPTVPLSERQLNALAWALATLRDCNPSAAYPPREAGCDHTDLTTATIEINHALRRERASPDRGKFGWDGRPGTFAGRVPFP